jgi:hypothetical protein
MNAETSCVKQAFTTVGSAHETITAMVRNGRVLRGTMQVYECSDCGLWHLSGSYVEKGQRKTNHRKRIWRPKGYRW